MFQNLDVFNLAFRMAQHAGTRQAVIAQNIAHANTPGYQARDVVPFQTLVGSQTDSGFQPQATRSAHLHGSLQSSSVQQIIPDAATASPSGNSVSVETEMLNAVNARRQHDRAMAIYKSSMTILRTSLGKV